MTAQSAKTAGGVQSEFMLVPEPPNTTTWLVDLPKDYKFRSWTPYRHLRFQHNAKGQLTTQWVEPTSTDDDIQQTILYVRDPAHGSYGQVTGILRLAPGRSRHTSSNWQPNRPRLRLPIGVGSCVLSWAKWNDLPLILARKRQ